MRIRNTKLSKRTLALLAATALLFSGGSFAGTKAALTYFSEDYTAGFELDHLHVHLMENGRDVCGGANDMYTVHRGDGAVGANDTKNTKYVGNLIEYLGYKNDNHTGAYAAYKIGTPGTVEPGRTYTEVIKAKNGNNINEYVRLTLRKYWVNKDRNKDTALSPALIKLDYKGGRADGAGNTYNSADWQFNAKESTAETQVYYLTKVLVGDTESQPLFDSLTIDKSVADLADVTTTTEHVTKGDQDVTIYTYSYDYDGYTFYIEADVQAIQTHNVNDAITSLWGVSNVSAADGVVSVK